MRRRKRTPLRSALGLASVALGAAAGPVAAQDRAGVTGAVIPQASSQRPNATMRSLSIGAEVVRNERITTDTGGRAQLMFLDQTAITVGANSEVTIDEFVYNPAQDTGTAAVSVGRGVMRFVGGRLSKSQDATIRTPVATIGIRGAITITEILPNLSTLIVFVFGDRVTIRASNGATRVLTQPGIAIIVTANGVIEDPFFPRPELLDRLLGLLGPSSGSAGPGLPGLDVVGGSPVFPGGIDLPQLRQIIIQSRPTFGY